MSMKRQAVWWRRGISGLMAAASHLGWSGASLEEGHLLDQARRETGLDDFGPAGFLEPMRLLVSEFRKYTRADTLGSFVFAQTLIASLKNRLNLTRVLKQHPEVRQVPIRAPLIVAGLPRTGTTFLQGLLSQVETMRPLYNWETNQMPAPLSLATEAQIQGQVRFSQKQIEGLYRISPRVLQAHELGPFEPEECNPFLMSSFCALLFVQFIECHEYMDYLYEKQFGDSYQWHKWHLQALSHGFPEKTWFLKGPAHLGSLGPLLATYPDARIVFTHRNPLECLPSMASLTSFIRILFSPYQDLHWMGRGMMERLKRILEAGYQARDHWPAPAHPFLDVTYQGLLKEPIATVRGILRHFQIREPENLDGKLQTYLAERRQHRHGAHRYTIEEFGITESEIRRDFAREFELSMPG